MAHVKDEHSKHGKCKKTQKRRGIKTNKEKEIE